MAFTSFASLVSLVSMHVKALLGSLCLLFVAFVSIGFSQSATTGGRSAETDYTILESQLAKNPKDTAAIQRWFENSLSPLANPDAMFSKECLAFVTDVADCNWGYDGSITAAELSRKWAKRFDVRSSWDHAFENGNCGWASRKLVKCEYLGELNGADWFRLVIKGGCGENDFSESLTRVVKVESAGGRYQITNMMNP
jgi:hypothetical protein